MADSMESKKLSLLRILQILETETDADHPLTQKQIAEILRTQYGIDLERKAISRNVSMLIEAGYDIESDSNGTYLASRPFTDAELRVLIDGVLASKYITARYSKDLINKLCGLSNKYFSSNVGHVHAVEEWDKTDNQDVFYNIELIDEAIRRKKQVRFDFNKYGPDKKLHRSAGHHVSPYQLIRHNQRYYLMGCNPFFKKMSFYRLDHITNMSILEKEKRMPVKSVPGYENGLNFKGFSAAHPYLFSDKPERVEFVAKEEMIDQVVDWFGKEVKITPTGTGQYRFSLTASPKAMEHWAMQFAGNVTITSPQSLVDNIRNRMEQALSMYKVLQN